MWTEVTTGWFSGTQSCAHDSWKYFIGDVFVELKPLQSTTVLLCHRFNLY